MIPVCSDIMDMGPGPGPEKVAIPVAVGMPFLGPRLGPGPISMRAEHMGVKGKQ